MTAVASPISYFLTLLTHFPTAMRAWSVFNPTSLCLMNRVAIILINQTKYLHLVVLVYGRGQLLGSFQLGLETNILII